MASGQSTTDFVAHDMISGFDGCQFIQVLVYTSVVWCCTNSCG